MGRRRHIPWPRQLAAVGLLALLVAGCDAGGPLTAVPQAPAGAAPVELPAIESVTATGGHVRVAYPDVPAAWVAPMGDDLAATDLAALWGLPLFRVDDSGQLRRGLVRSFVERAEGDRFVVELELADGEWSDGSPVEAADVVATVSALQAAGSPSLATLQEVTEVDGRVLLVFAQHYEAWPFILAGSGGVLPAAQLAAGGLEAFADSIPVSGGWFRLDAHEPGRSATFVANPASPLGAPAVDQVTVLFVPRYESALGFLAAGDVDVLLGHLALNPVPRAEEIEEVHAAAPLGGTSVFLEVRPDGRLGDVAAEVRQEVLSAVEIGQLVEGLLGPAGAPATSLYPGREGPFVEERLGVSDAPGLVMLVPRWHEALGFAGRTIERDLESHQVVTDIVSEETPAFTRTARSRYDLVLRIRRDPPIPTLANYARPDERATVASAGLAEQPQADQLVETAGFVRPMFRIAPAHAWRDGLQGIRPSAWPGLAFWNVGVWTLEAG